jgi:hypothetical protein
LSRATFMSSILAESLSSASVMASALPMGTGPGLSDTKLSRVRELVGGIQRRLYSKAVAGRGPGPRLPGGAMVELSAEGGGRTPAKLHVNLSLPSVYSPLAYMTPGR